MITAKLLLAAILQSVDITGVNIDVDKINIDEAYCLAKNVYYESKGEDIQGQYAVAAVTINRANDPRYPSTICDVVKQVTVSNITKKIVCQFSWYCEPDKKDKDISFRNKDGSINQVAVDQFQIASIVAITAMSGDINDNTKGATHFHNPFTSNPPWRHTLRKTMRSGNHDFYKSELKRK